MNRYGLFNDIRTTTSSATFFAIQGAISSYPNDPLRNELHEIVGAITSSNNHLQQSLLVSKGCELAAKAVQFTEYCVWDYTLVSKIAKSEFNSWVDGINENINSKEEHETNNSLVPADTSYFVVTLAMLSTHVSLKAWLEFLELKSRQDFFTRKSIEQIWNRFAKPSSKIVKNCTNALFAITPVSKDRFYTGTQLRTDDWEYLRPVY
jgi:hypothetical protein